MFPDQGQDAAEDGPAPGSDAELRELFHKYYARTLRMVRRRVGNRHTAEDLVQQVWVEFCNFRKQKPEHPNPPAVLLKILYCRVGDHFRRVKRAGHLIPVEDGDLELLAAAQLEPDEATGAVRRVDLQRALAGLSPRERQALQLHHLDGLSEKECAAVMGLKIDNMKKILKKARSTLRGALGMDGRQAKVTEVRR